MASRIAQKAPTMPRLSGGLAEFMNLHTPMHYPFLTKAARRPSLTERTGLNQAHTVSR